MVFTRCVCLVALNKSPIHVVYIITVLIGRNLCGVESIDFLRRCLLEKRRRGDTESLAGIDLNTVFGITIRGVLRRPRKGKETTPSGSFFRSLRSWLRLGFGEIILYQWFES
jgi:hypothetical protein